MRLCCRVLAHISFGYCWTSMPRLARTRRTAAARSAKVTAGTSVPTAAVVAPAGGTVEDAGGLERRQEDLPRMKAGLQLRMEEFSALRTKEHGGSGVSFVVTEAGARRVAAACKCSLCGSSCELGDSKRSNVSTGLSMTISCSGCGEEVFADDDECVRGIDGSETKLDASKVRLVYDSLVSGRGFSGLEELLFNMGLPKMFSKTYETYAGFLYGQVDALWSTHGRELGEVMGEQLRAGGVTAADDGIYEVAVSYDGTWMTRGFRSHVGVGFVMDVDKGFVLDVEVVSNFCQKCSRMEKQLSPDDFAAWKETHTRCTKNFDGKSGAMEVEAARRLWQRSERRGFRYTTFVGDGDSATYNAVCAFNDGAGPYLAAQVVKEECVNHVAKRMGTRLRQLKKDVREVQQTKKGKSVMRSRLAGRDGLTDADIDNIARHYGQTIRGFDPTGSVEDLRRRILAIYYHARSTASEPNHADCPPGEDSWCWVKRAEATGEVAAPHTSKNLYLSGLTADLLGRVLQVFISLTQPSLLSRCMRKETQNRNESLHSKLWRVCLKTKFAYLQRAVFAAKVTSLQHNLGKVDGHVLVALGLIPRESWSERKRKESTPQKPTPAKRRRRDKEQPSSSYASGGF